MPFRPSHRPAASDSSSEAESHAIHGIPLLTFSRTPSPSPYPSPYTSPSGSSRLNDGYDDADGSSIDEEEEDIPLSLRRQGDRGVNESRAWDADWRRNLRAGGIGQYLFGSWAGWHAWVAFLVLAEAVSAFAVTTLLRVVLWTGVYKFPYPVTVTFLGHCFGHCFLLLAAGLSRALADPLRRVGLQSIIAPASTAQYPGVERALGDEHRAFALRKLGFLCHNILAIGGGGVFEFNQKLAWICAPLAVAYVGKTVLSTISYAYGSLELYTLSRIGAVPLTLLFTGVFTPATHSISTLSASWIATLTLLMACTRSGLRATWESIVAGIFSSFVVALYPIFLARTHRRLGLALMETVEAFKVSAAGNEDAASHTPTVMVPIRSTSQLDSIAYWKLLHYTSILSMALLFPLTVVSREVPSILRNCYFLDVIWFWCLLLLLSLAATTLFGVTLALVRATSPMTTNFVKLPRNAFELAVLSGGRMPAHAWVGCAFTWVTSLWYAIERREEGRARERRRLMRG